MKPEKNAPADRLHEQAKAFMQGGNYAAAEELLEQVLTAHETAAAYHDLGLVYRARGKADAEQAFLAAAALDPDHHPSYAALGDYYAAHGDATQALEGYARALNIRPDNPDYGEKFLNFARYVLVMQHNQALRDLFGKCLENPALDFAGMGAAWQRLLVSDPAFAPVYQAGGKEGGSALVDPFFLNGLRRTVVFDRAFEKFLTVLRRRLLEEKEFPGKGRMKLAAALAHYCFTTEYIFDVTPEEQKRVDALSGAKTLTEDEAAILACYRPPYTFAAPPLFADIVESWRAQQEIKKSIVSLTDIEDDVSKKVQEQYEEFPYPRWQGFAHLIKDEEAEGHLRGKKASILVAGCGTGKEPIELATVFPDAHILAFDLSKASLAYGMAKAREEEIENITFRHGDILGLADFDQRFDYVTASGVLHHMDDPARGWEILARLLKPGGLMRIGLYSRLARQPISRARKIIAEKKYNAAGDGIRAFRRDIDGLMDGKDRDFITGMRDYYYMSDCRDLLFHVQEHQMDLPQIGEQMKKLGLDLVKLYLADNVLQKYRRQFPRDPACRNLENWAAFEKQNPATFREMYKFWCRKRA